MKERIIDLIKSGVYENILLVYQLKETAGMTDLEVGKLLVKQFHTGSQKVFPDKSGPSLVEFYTYEQLKVPGLHISIKKSYFTLSIIKSLENSLKEVLTTFKQRLDYILNTIGKKDLLSTNTTDFGTIINMSKNDTSWIDTFMHPSNQDVAVVEIAIFPPINIEPIVHNFLILCPYKNKSTIMDNGPIELMEKLCEQIVKNKGNSLFLKKYHDLFDKLNF